MSFLSDFKSLVEGQEALKKDQDILKQRVDSLKKVQDENASKQHQRILQTDMTIAGLGENTSSSGYMCVCNFVHVFCC